MKCQRLNFLKQEIEIVSIEIPRYQQLQKIAQEIHSLSSLSFNENWWVINENNPNIPLFLNANGKAVTTKSTDLAAIRPLIIFKNRDYETLSPEGEGEKHYYRIGEEFVLQDNLFKVIGRIKDNCIALCEVPVGYSFFRKNVTTGTTSSFETSELNQNFERWKKKLPYVGGYRRKFLKVSKVVDKGTVEFTAEVRLPVQEDIRTVPDIYKLPSATPFWLFGRNDEFSGFCYERGGVRNFKALSLSAMANVCPVLIVKDKEAITGDELCFSVKGYLLRLYRDDVLFCLNPIGYSCYSTGIDDEESEIDFYAASEVADIIHKWYTNINT